MPLLAHDPNARRATLAFLGVNGAGFVRDPEVARELRERLAWAIIDEMGKSTPE